MRKSLSIIVATLIVPWVAFGIPQEFLGGFGGGIGGLPGVGGGGGVALLDGQDFSEAFLDESNWETNELPGEWRQVPALSSEDVRAIKMVPKLFGAYPRAVYASSETWKLRSISILYIDAGTYFGYVPATIEGDAEAERERKRKISEKKHDFKKQFNDLSEVIEDDLEDRADSRAKKARVGRTPVLRIDYLDFIVGKFVLRYSVLEDHAITLTIMPEDGVSDHYMDERLAKLKTRDRRKELEASVTRGSNGDVAVEGVPVFRQGNLPYCAINTLGMVTHHLGLRLGVTGLAAGAKFKNTGSAKGSKLIDLYRAAAVESSARMVRGRTEFARIKRSIDDGCPVVVWRRYSSQRDRLHTRFARKITSRPDSTLPEANHEEQATWPGESAPGHASVITGYNEERGEVIFVESWGEHIRGRRMRQEEMQATSYMTFYFKV
jgi:hypothetical protein